MADTGSNDGYAVNNIYDMAGNVDEWTMEAYAVGRRVLRGGGYNSIDVYCPASKRGGDIYGPSSVFDHFGFRLALYIK